MVLVGNTASTPDGSNAPDPIPIFIRIDGGLSSNFKEKYKIKLCPHCTMYMRAYVELNENFAFCPLI